MSHQTLPKVKGNSLGIKTWALLPLTLTLFVHPIAWSDTRISIQQAADQIHFEYESLPESLKKAEPQSDHYNRKLLLLDELSHALQIANSSIQSYPHDSLSTVIDEIAVQKFLDLYSEKHPALSSELDFVSIYRLFELIEQNKDFWISDKSKVPNPEVYLADRTAVPVRFEFDENNEIYIQFLNRRLGKNLLGRGAYKKVEKIFSYTKLNWLAKVTPIDQDKYTLASFREEVAVFRKLAQLPSSQTRGLMTAEAIGDDAFYLPLMAGDYINLTYPNPSSNQVPIKFTSDEQFSILLEASEGVYNLQKHLGLLHGDFKRENVLIALSEHSNIRNVTTRVTDFGTTLNIFDLLHHPERLQFGGSYPGMAPELVHNTLKFITSERTRYEYIKKIDSYSLGYFAAHVFEKYEYIPWEYECEKWIFPSRLLSLTELHDFNQCRHQSSQVLRNEMRKLPALDLKGELILSALQSEPSYRLSVKDFISALKLLQNLSTEITPDSSKYPEKSSWMSAFMSSLFSVGEPPLPHFVKWSESKALSQIKRQKGNYLLLHSTPSLHSPLARCSDMTLVYVDELLQPQVKQLRNDPHHPSSLLDTLSFLKYIGMIHD